MSILITYRNNFFYYLMMPGPWASGVLIYLGLGNAYLIYIVVKLTVILGPHVNIAFVGSRQAPVAPNEQGHSHPIAFN